MNYEKRQIAQQAILNAVNSIDNGIIVEFHDHLSMDAFIIRVRKDGKDVPFTESYRFPYYTAKDRSIQVKPLEKETNELEVIMVSDSEYYCSVGLYSTIKMLEKKHYGLPVYMLDLGWYTFPNKYMKVGESWLESDRIPDWLSEDKDGNYLRMDKRVKLEKSMLHVDYTPEEKTEE